MISLRFYSGVLRLEQGLARPETAGSMARERADKGVCLEPKCVVFPDVVCRNAGRLRSGFSGARADFVYEGCPFSGWAIEPGGTGGGASGLSASI